MRWVLNIELLRLMPCTIYPFFSNDSAKYAPSCPVTPVIRAVFAIVYILITAIILRKTHTIATDSQILATNYTNRFVNTILPQRRKDAKLIITNYSLKIAGLQKLTLLRVNTEAYILISNKLMVNIG